REECQASRINSPRISQFDRISERLADAMSVGIPPFLTLSQKPSALRDKSGTFQNPDRFCIVQKLRYWISLSIKPRSFNENRYHYRPRSSRTDLRCIRFEYLLALHSHAATVAGAGWRLHQGPFPEPLPSRCRRIPNRRRLAIAYRALRPSRLASARSRHCEHRPRSHLDGPQRPANGQRHIDLVGLSCLAIPRRVRGHRARLIRLWLHQSTTKPLTLSCAATCAVSSKRLLPVNIALPLMNPWAWAAATLAPIRTITC